MPTLCLPLMARANKNDVSRSDDSLLLLEPSSSSVSETLLVLLLLIECDGSRSAARCPSSLADTCRCSTESKLAAALGSGSLLGVPDGALHTFQDKTLLDAVPARRNARLLDSTTCVAPGSLRNSSPNESLASVRQCTRKQRCFRRTVQ